MVLVLLNILVLFSLLASNNFGRDLLNVGSLFRIPENIHQGSGVTSGMVQLQEPEMECSHENQVKSTAIAKLEQDGSARLASHEKQVKPTAAVKLERDGSSSSTEMRMDNVCAI